MAKTEIVITKTGKEYVARIGHRELETMDVVMTKNGTITLTVNHLEIWDDHYLSVPKEFEQLHQDLMSVINDIKKLNKLYMYMLTADSIRKKHFSEHGILPYYNVPIVTMALLEHSACIMQAGVLRKNERFTRFLILRDEMISESTGANKHTMGSIKDLGRIKMDEEKEELKYRLPPITELNEMSYDMLTQELAKAESLLAKSRVLKILKDLRVAKTATKIRKSERQSMKEAIEEEQSAQDEKEPESRLAKHQRKKAIKQHHDEVRYEKPKSKSSIKISKVEGAEYLE